MAKEIELVFARFSAQDPQTIGTFIMKHRGVMRVLILLAAVAAILGAYIKGREDVLLGEFKQYQANMLTLTQWETNQPPELKAFVKAHYYYLANRIPKSWVGHPHDFGMVSTNVIHLTGFKGPTSAREEYRKFLERFPDTTAKAD